MRWAEPKECEGPYCDRKFYPSRSDARFCSDTCRQQAHRQRTAGVTAVTANSAVTDTEGAVTAKSPVTARGRSITGKVVPLPQMPIRIFAFWGDVASVAMRELAKPEEESVSVTRSELETLAAVLRWLTESGEWFDLVMPEGFETVAYRAEQKAIRERQVAAAIGEASEPEAKELIEELRQHIKELKRQARERDRWAP